MKTQNQRRSNVDLSQNFDCDACDYSAEMEVPLGAEFFWPDR